MRSLRHLPADTKPRTNIASSLAWRREEKKKEALDHLFSNGRERVIGNQTNIGTVSKTALWEISERRDGAHMGFPKRVDIILT